MPTSVTASRTADLRPRQPRRPDQGERRGRSLARLSLGGEAAVAVAIGSDNQTAYAVTTAGRLHAISLANPRSPQVTATVDLGAEASGLGLNSDGSRGFRALGAEGVVAVDLSRPTHPLLLGRIVTPDEPQSAIVTTNGQLPLAANSAGLFVQDVTPLAGFSIGAAAVTAILGGPVESRGAGGDVEFPRRDGARPALLDGGQVCDLSQ